MNALPRFDQFNFPTFFVGGFVRDHFMGVKSKDVDLVMVAPDFDTMVSEIERVGGEIFQARPEFLVARANVPNIGPVDFALPRTDGDYSDGRHPDSTSLADNIEADLSRRDYSMNAVAVNVATHEVVDPFGGLADARDRVLAAVGSPKARFEEDALRVFRALRFKVVKDMVFDPVLADAIRRLDVDFSAVSTERIREELLKMFKHDSLHSVTVLFQTFPHLGSLVLERGIWFKPTVES
jgi:tRNA nucleotidyltransferase/poly(A) polymerase